MNNAEFEATLRKALSGSELDLERIFEIYEPLFHKYSCVKGKYSEDMHQMLLLHVALNLHKFPL